MHGVQPGGLTSDLDGLPQLYEAFEGWKSICVRANNLQGIKGMFSMLLLFLKLWFSFTVAHFLA